MIGAVEYTFAPLTPDDLPTLAGWLREPHVSRWWGAPSDELSLLAQDLDEPLMRQWLISIGGIPFAYAQAYPVHVWPQAHFDSFCPESFSIDAFIGAPDMLGQGHGAGLLRALAQLLLSCGASIVVFDPDAGNVRACRASRRAGFVLDKIVDTDGGPLAVMVFRP